MNKHAGFTLIELLVVVLIIGVLAAVALPQYEKAVWKSRATQLQTAVKSIAQAQDVYFMANGTYASEYSQLDVNFDNLKALPAFLSVSSSDAVRGTDDFAVVLNIYTEFAFTSGVFRTDKFYKSGFTYWHFLPGFQPQLVCAEHISTTAGSFCAELMGTSRTPILEKYNFRYYALS